jgi:glycyl-tRNA synthetase beta chain
VIRLARENLIRINLLDLLFKAAHGIEESIGKLRFNAFWAAKKKADELRGYVLNEVEFPVIPETSIAETGIEVFLFLIERLRVTLRSEGARHDILTAVFAAANDYDIVRLLARTSAVAALLGTEDGANLLQGYRRATNIVRIEEKKDGAVIWGELDVALLTLFEEDALYGALQSAGPTIAAHLKHEDFAAAMMVMARLRAPIDAFFDKVTVNAPEPELRRNRLRLLAQARATMDQVADFSRVES